MTTPDELDRAVERLSGGMGKYGFANVYNDDVQLLLSERAELLATVERLRAVESSQNGGITTNWHRNPDGPEAADLIERMADLLEIANRSTDRPSGYVSRLVIAARAALTTGEAAGSQIGQNDQPGLAFSGEWMAE